MNEIGRCRNMTYDHPCHPAYAAKYDGYCLDCANAGVPELVDRVRELEAVAQEYLDGLQAAERVEASAVDNLSPRLAELRRRIVRVKRALAVAGG